MEFSYETEPWYKVSMTNTIDTVFYIFQNYGWHLLISSIIIVIIYVKFIKPVLNPLIEKYKRNRFENEYLAKYHKNPDLFSAHVSGQQLWAEKMQEKYNKAAEQYDRKQKEKEERKRQELVEKHGGPSGHTLGGGNQSDNKPNTLKPDYNPLMGNGSSSNYRPPRRSPCGGGGCGR